MVGRVKFANGATSEAIENRKPTGFETVNVIRQSNHWSYLMKATTLSVTATLIVAISTASQASLVIYHEFENETAGIFTDTQGNFNGTSEPAAGLLDTSEKKIGSGSALLGGSQRIDLGVTDSSLVGIPGFTVTAWIRPTDINAGDRYIFGNTDSGKASVIFRMDGSELEVGLYTGTTWSGNPNDRRSSGAGLAAGTWTHVALVWDGDAATLYSGGNSVGSWDLADGNLNRQSGTPPSAIGAINGNSTGYFKGNIDDFAIWDEALTQPQIAGLASETLTPLTVPEPTTLALATLGLLGFGRRRKR
jgi:hypothetical protein